MCVCVCVSECDRQASIMSRPLPTGDCWAAEKEYQTGVVNRLRAALPRVRISHPSDVSSLKRTDQFWTQP